MIFVLAWRVRAFFWHPTLLSAFEVCECLYDDTKNIVGMGQPVTLSRVVARLLIGGLSRGPEHVLHVSSDFFSERKQETASLTG